ncbi:C-type lectin domain family 4 member M CD209 antigen-like protein 1 [Channa argus]|uniref:C-type lectin domain family 4 member M CD209 antigen-like protein 1 n=2 Tax=Channa argus TaxID=215402 RepID=A0A6G1PB59_CHAAH|nr:C-type lectin domain family 4 member M CD209 antigen-like protein 1 [Channa argus]
MEMANFHDASARSRGLKTCTGKDGKGMKGQIFHRWVAVSFCLLCILQAALNITLRLALSVGSNCKNLSDVKEEWKRINTTLQLNSFTKELDNLQKQLNFNASQKTVLAKERDELKRKLDDFTSQKTVLAKERDELKRKLDDFIHYSQKGWVYFSGSFYYVSSTQKTWTESRDDCLEQNADLMIINSKEEQNFSRQFQKVMWLGLSDRETEGVWKWVDGTVLTERFSFWSSGEPNNYNGRNEDCGMIWYYNTEDSWNDGVCENENFWICEKKMAL